jgi:hypothetical protein
MAGRAVFIAVASSALLVSFAQDPGSAGYGPLSEALHVLPPLGRARGELPLDRLDASLLDDLRVSVIDASRTPVAEITSQGDAPTRLRLHGHLYRATWEIADALVDQPLVIRFLVADLEVRSISIVPHSSRPLSVRFYAEKHPWIRARVLAVRGATATENAWALLEEFDVNAEETAQILFVEGYGGHEIAWAVREVHLTNAATAAWILDHLGFGALDVAEILRDTFELGGAETVRILGTLGYLPDTLDEIRRVVFDEPAWALSRQGPS